MEFIRESIGKLYEKYNYTQDMNLDDWVSGPLLETEELKGRGNIFFGPYPNTLMLSRLQNEKFTTIVDLTGEEIDDCDRYNGTDESKNLHFDTVKFLSYNIEDNGVPEDPVKYCNFISRLYHLVYCGEKLYIHCKAGRGRSSMVCTSLLCVILDCDFMTSIERVSTSYNNRAIVNSKWKSKKTPINYNQFMFIRKIHKNIYVDHPHGFHWLCDFSVIYLSKYDDLFQDFLENKDLGYRMKLTYFRRMISKDKANRDYINMIHTIRLFLFFIDE